MIISVWYYVKGRPEGLHLRTLQALQEIGIEKNQTTIMMIPAEFIQAAHAIPELLKLFPKELK